MAIIQKIRDKYAKVIHEELNKLSVEFSRYKDRWEKLSKNIPFVRVDFYSVNGKSVFGEMTFYPGDARNKFYPEEFNEILGNYFELPKLTNGKPITQYTIT